MQGREGRNTKKLKSRVKLKDQQQKKKLEDIKQFQVGRSKDDKEKQVTNQVLVIKNWEHEVDRLKELFDKIKSGQDYLNLMTDSISTGE